MTSLATVLRAVVLASPEVSRLSSVRRAASLFSQGQTAESVYFIEDGLVKLTRTNQEGGHIILAVVGPGQLFGEEALAEQPQPYYSEAEVLSSSANLLSIPCETLNRALHSHPELGTALVAYLLQRKLVMAEKVELLCLHDVEYRILHYLAELTALVKPAEGEGYQLPITQLELADLIGATRETTSTTLNQLERRGLVKLSRRLLTIQSPSLLRSAADAKGALPIQAAAANADATHF